MVSTDYEAVIGLEVHVQLATESKIFSSASAKFGASPNTHIDPLVFGLPGSLPVLNRRVVEYGVMTGIALNCQIKSFNQFARKHYFYPDLPKGYQISQFEEPICKRGHINIEVGDASRSIGITRIHMEEDAGKSMHESGSNCSLLDLNRAGVPLLEIVSEPDLRSAAEASAYLKAIRQVVRWLGVSDGNMEEGSLRCDANISLRPRGQLEFGTRTEIKNLNSFKFVEKAIEYEIARQLSVLKSGEEVFQETRLFDSEAGVTREMRGKEESADYRYFPDPDLPPLYLEESWISEVRSKMPQLPAERRAQLVESLGLSNYDAGVLTSERDRVEFFEVVFEVCGNAKLACNWVTSELLGALNKEGLELQQSKITARQLGTLIKLVEKDIISGKMAKSVFEEMLNSGKDPEVIVEEKGLKQITDPEQIREVVNSVLDQNQEQLDDYVSGNQKIMGFFVGQVMKATAGSANPKIVNQILREEIEARKH